MTKIKNFDDENDNSHKYVHLHFIIIIISERERERERVIFKISTTFKESNKASHSIKGSKSNESTICNV